MDRIYRKYKMALNNLSTLIQVSGKKKDFIYIHVPLCVCELVNSMFLNQFQAFEEGF